MRIVEKKPVEPQLSLQGAFKAQRTKDGHSRTLRAQVARLLSEGKASTDVVGEVFELIVRRMGPSGRVTNADVANVLRGFDVAANGGPTIY